ncbi:MAG TPA: tetratricopeptide repeat protein, partial [Polyangiales bacterium]|nr:tetratricopeptide repeat protein [Polyangiales bacterium]
AAACATPSQPPAAKPAAPTCLATISGEGGAEQQLRRAQAKLSTTDTAASTWVEVGQAWMRVARVRTQPQLYRAAEDCTTQALARAPHDAAALRLRGLMSMNAHRFAEARALALELLARDPADSLSWGTLSDAELELGRVPEAMAAAQQMVDLKPSLLSYGRAAHLRWMTGDVAGAKQLYRAAIAAGQQQVDPEPRSWMIVQAAWVFWHEGDYEGAARGFELALSQVPAYAPALEGLGRTALARGDYREAARVLERAQGLHPLAETAWWLGDAYALAGDRVRAAAAYREVERLAAGADPRTLAAFYAARAREPAQAVRLAQLAFAERQDCYSKDVLAFALFRSGELQEAKRLAGEAIALGVRDARLLYHAGMIFRAAGAAAEGVKLMHDALRLNLGFDPRLTGDSHATTTARL